MLPEGNPEILPVWQVATWLQQRNRMMAKPKEQGEATIEMESLGQRYGADDLGAITVPTSK